MSTNLRKKQKSSVYPDWYGYRQSKWSKEESPFRVHTVVLPESHSVGDVMRDLDTKGVIKGDFLLINGDVICNIDFQAVLKAHNERKSKDRNAIMTMVLREATALHRTRQRTDPGIFILDEENGRCLRYEISKKSGSVPLDIEVLAEQKNVAFRNDLIDCRIDICTVDVPALFQENFDYDNIRADFVRGILTSDLLGKTIYTHIIDSKYAARVHSPQTYDAISKDIIARYTYPITLDHNLLDDQTFSYQRGHIYKEDGVVLAQSCHVESSSVIGAKTFIGDKSIVQYSVIGRGCKIGKNVRLTNAHIWENVEIKDNVTITEAIIASNVIINENAIIEPGAIISFGVVVGSDKKISGDIRLTTSSDTSSSNADIVGEDGQGYVYGESESDGDDEDDDDKFSDDYKNEEARHLDGLVYTMGHLNISDTSIASVKKGSRISNHRRFKSTESARIDVSDDEDESFTSEAVASVERSIIENHSTDVATLELNTLRMTMNASYEEVREATMCALVRHITRLVNTQALEVKASTTQVFKKWAPMIEKQIFEDLDQADLLQRLQNQCATRPLGSKIFFWAAVALYDLDIVEEDYIRKWYNSSESTINKELAVIHSAFSPWMKWLDEAEEEGSEEESD